MVNWIKLKVLQNFGVFLKKNQLTQAFSFVGKFIMIQAAIHCMFQSIFGDWIFCLCGISQIIFNITDLGEWKFL